MWLSVSPTRPLNDDSEFFEYFSFLYEAIIVLDEFYVKGRVGLTEKRIFNYAKQYITPHLITEEHENDNEKI